MREGMPAEERVQHSGYDALGSGDREGTGGTGGPEPERELFLFGGGFGHFERLSEPFVAASGGASARIGLLFWDAAHIGPYFDRYARVWTGLGATVIPIAPDASGRFNAAALQRLRECTALFIPGGETRKYHEVYVKSDVRAVIEELYRAGKPYGGFSAGAMLVPGICITWGDLVTSESSGDSGHVFVGGSESGCNAPVTLDRGFGFLQGVIVETHFTSRIGFRRLAFALESSGVRLGLGIDDDVCVRISNERWMRVYGRGRCSILGWDPEKAVLQVRPIDPSGEPVDLPSLVKP